MSAKFGEKPTTPPPNPNEPWLWIGGKWVLVVTDTGDGVPETLFPHGDRPKKK